MTLRLRMSTLRETMLEDVMPGGREAAKGGVER